MLYGKILEISKRQSLVNLIPSEAQYTGKLALSCRAVFEMGGGGGGGGVRGVNPHNCTGPWHLCFSRGPRVGPLKPPPPPQ